jgi:hypothetical protein
MDASGAPGIVQRGGGPEGLRAGRKGLVSGVDRAGPPKPAGRRRLRRVAIACAALAVGACRARADRPAASVETKIAWHTVGSWSGHGNRQTESFPSESGALRIRWETTHEAAPGLGRFRLTAHSAISGRVLQEVVDQRGNGNGVGYVQQDPHMFYVVVDSDQVDWAFTIDEATVYR